MIAIACNAELMNNNRTWVIDSSATKHTCNERKAFTNLDKDKQSTLYTATKYSRKSINTGEVLLNARLHKDKKSNEIEKHVTRTRFTK